PATRPRAAADSGAAAARAALRPRAPDDVVAILARALPLLVAADSLLPATPAGRELSWYVRAELEDAAAALAAAQRLVFDATAPAEQVAPGSNIEVTETLWNGGARPVTWHLTPDSAITVGPGELATRPLRLSAPGTVTEPYFLRSPRQGDLYAWPEVDGSAGLPFDPPLAVPFAVTVAGAPVRVRQELTYRAVSAVTGESRRPVRVAPAVSVLLDREAAVRPRDTTTPLPVVVRLAEEVGAPVEGELRLQLPSGWTASPLAAPVRLAPGEGREFRFAVSPPAGLRAGRYEIAAAFRDAAGREYTRGFRLIDYPHIQPYPLFADAHMAVTAVDVTVPPALRTRPVGYVMGAGDEVPAALAQLGIRVEPLTAESLGAGTDLARYGTIVIGVRVFDTRPELAGANPRLLEWVRSGGTLVVQYQQAVWAERGLAPYPLTFARPADRVTDETAPVTMVEPASPLLTVPNRIGAADWLGWVQERGLWFPRSWDAHWQPLLAMADPGQEPQQGALLVAPFGTGTVIYTGLAFFRQLPAGVPGAYRLFVNLLAGGR
ncbi:MAG: hypothetical protein FIB01_02845, partial [Gemmatimonadetes bacterium]|nr:hypothetical protein [Gemmatimonadota bacterium]